MNRFLHTPRGLATAATLMACVFLGGCAGGGHATSSGPSTEAVDPRAGQYDEGAVIHHVTVADMAFAQSTKPLDTDGAVLWVNGLGCPQCASNVDLQLERIKGIASIHTDLSNGKVSVAFGKGPRPSPSQLAEAVADSGFTLVKVEPGTGASAGG